ncbi:hypothetical protein G9U51_09145 [Calidifontibacter sp. DB0510]|uniref:DUF2530 domain-containing protein n=1 Tax=Metallococcus carri TaxID=1656884 RepID=A0A967EAJ1_9MICO|nr:hypothetical protein [Metallococcus carri]NHN55939.1 hypothetical protein [Metallococcus carri]NOP37604.1 hypothetical protein [Calidifontibacter sp. DB2511S]
MTGPSDDDIDRRFAEIIGEEWPSSPVDSDASAKSDEAEPQPEPDPEPAPLDLPDQWRMPTGQSLIDEVDTFTPPQPRPLPRDEMFWVIAVCLIGGPLWLLYLFLFDRYAGGLWWVLACATSVMGVVLLVIRQPPNREDQDPDDDGAVL